MTGTPKDRPGALIEIAPGKLHKELFLERLVAIGVTAIVMHIQDDVNAILSCIPHHRQEFVNRGCIKVEPQGGLEAFQEIGSRTKLMPRTAR